MRRTIVLVLTGAAVVAGLVQGGALAAPRQRASTSHRNILIRIEGAKRTLAPRALVHPGTGWITRGAARKGECPRQSVQGALNAATHGQWTGKWNAQFKEYFITSILGEKPSGHKFWEIFVNNKAATKGACDLKLQRSGTEQILFADTNGKLHPSAMGVIRSTKSGSGTTFLIELVGYNAAGKAKPLAGVPITGGSQPATTNAKGQAQVTEDHSGPLLLRSAPKGYIRSEVEVFAP